ncbi:MAG: DUF4974 domain-containing protein [Bacteroidales bacterium]|nr:DUF4974 domain-containing protein [Bacteroidales bacterium]
MLDEKEIRSLLPDYARGCVSEQDGKQIDEWICSSAANRKEAEDCLNLEYLQSRIESIDNADTDDALSRVHSRMRREQGRSGLRWLVYCAAILSIPLMVATAWLSSTLRRSTLAAPIEIRCTTGMVSCTTLPDGSRVWLNSNSRLSYPAVFGSERRVVLEGEGYFEVAKAGGRRFIVEAGGQQVEVTGTEFDIEAYTESCPEVRTTLISGSILLHCPDASGRDHVFNVNPGEQFIYNRESRKLMRVATDGNQVTAWKEGKTILDNTSLEDALRAIGNRFNVEFMVRNQSLLSNRYTGTFSGQRLEVVLEHFKRTTNIHFETDLTSADPDNLSGRQIIIVY